MRKIGMKSDDEKNKNIMENQINIWNLTVYQADF